jgi:hypothetical protein
MGQLVAQDAREAGIRRVEAEHRHLDRAVVPALGPVGGPRGVAEGRARLEHHGDRLLGPESQPLGVFRVGLGQDLEHGHPDRLIHAAFVADPELGVRGRLLALQGGQRFVEQGPAPRIGLVEAERLFGGFARPAWVAEGELGGREGLERGDGAGVAEEREAGVTERLAGVPRGQALPTAQDVGIEASLARRGLDPVDQIARKDVDPAVLLVADLGALVPGPVGLDHAAALQDDRVGSKVR